MLVRQGLALQPCIVSSYHRVIPCVPPRPPEITKYMTATDSLAHNRALKRQCLSAGMVSNLHQGVLRNILLNVNLPSFQKRDS